MIRLHCYAMILQCYAMVHVYVGIDIPEPTVQEVPEQPIFIFTI